MTLGPRCCFARSPSSHSTCERIAGAIVQAADGNAIKLLLVHFEIGADEKLGRQVLDGETDRVGRAGEALVSDRLARGSAVTGGKKLGGGKEVERSQPRVIRLHLGGASASSRVGS